MKKLFTAAFVALALLSGSAHAVEVGKAAPDYTFKDINGAEHSIAKFKGKTVVLEWTNPGCPFVKKFYNANEMQRLQKQAVADPSVVWISINSSAPGKEGNLNAQEAQKYINDNKAAQTAYVLDPSGAFGKLYGAKTTPHMFVIDKEGTLVYQGAIDSIKGFDPAEIPQATNYIVEALTALKAGKKPATTSSQPYGCSVKYAD